MNVFLYAKYTENIETFDPVICLFQNTEAAVTVTVEGRRMFRELDQIMHDMEEDDVAVIGSLSSLGITDADIANRLNWFCKSGKMLVICDYASTYEYGIKQPTNQAVLETILQSLLKQNNNILEISGSRRSHSGRSRISFPNCWEELYLQWEKGEISSSQFLKQTGLKKATFYNLITEYKTLKASRQEYQKRFRMG